MPVAGGRTLVPDDYSLGDQCAGQPTDTAGNVTFLGAEQLQDSLGNDFDGLLPAPVCTITATTMVNTSISFYDSESFTPQPVYIELDGCRRILISDHQPLSATTEIVGHSA